ncbi:hypothetical protein [Tateyamaria sp. SN6-1]|uniref:hypothetical protein n=1 Tax=Tateyamaria sp. SN6-1 TaxID=3092148 RepID=UPI0039F4B3F2
MIPFDVPEGEAPLLHWTISRRSYAIRMVTIVLATPLILSPFLVIAAVLYGPSLGLLQQWATAIPFALLLTWVLGDFSIWRENRDSDWLLTTRAIHFRNMIDPDTRLPLTAIRRINRWPLWSLVLRLETGKAVTLPLVPHPAETRQRILDAREACL